MHAFSEILLFISENIIKGTFISILFLILINAVSKNKIQISVSVKIIKWMLIVYAAFTLLHMILIYFLEYQESLVWGKRVTGSYWWAYWIMFSTNTLLPLLLLNNKISRKIYVILIISILMNVGWLLESFVIHMTGMERGVANENYNPYLPSNAEQRILINGLVIGVIVLMIGNSYSYIKTKMTYNEK